MAATPTVSWRDVAPSGTTSADGAESSVEPSNLDADSFNPATPLRLLERVRVSVPDGKVDLATITVLGSEHGWRDAEMTNVLRAVIALEPTSCAKSSPYSDPGNACVLITRLNEAVGRVQFIHARCVLSGQQNPAKLRDLREKAQH